MSPSPGASVCLYNAMRDAEHLAASTPGFVFDKERMLRELCDSTPLHTDDVSLAESYPS